MPKYIKDDKVIEATERAYNLIYKSQGYKPITNYKEMTVAELKDLAKAKDIEGYYDMKKDELIAALEGE
ncbi:MAG: hypothetical protein PWQ37_26 [Candidatus Petromonas sp.]|jgi:hypothetical protein|nr:hypothetical protein [Candidatus Petromonas sp.]